MARTRREHAMSLGSYGKLATEVYDIDKPIGRSYRDVEFYLERLRSCTGRILEPGVGTGRMLIPLLEAGLAVEGVDSSPEPAIRASSICRPDLPMMSVATEASFTLAPSKGYSVCRVLLGRRTQRRKKMLLEDLLPGTWPKGDQA
jgi:hypothetical protein